MNESEKTEKKVEKVEKVETQVTTPTLVPAPVPTTETKTEHVEESTTVEKK